MSKRLMLILTRPADDSLEEFIKFRENAKIRMTKNKPAIIKEDLIKEWEKFWSYLNYIPGKKYYAGNFIN